MVFRGKSGRGKADYLITAYKAGEPQHSIRYDKFETAILGFLSREDWIAIAGASESEEEKIATVALEATLQELDKVSRRIEQINKAMDVDDIDAGTLNILANKLNNDIAVMNGLTAKKQLLQGSIDAARSKSSALYEVDYFLNLLKQNIPSLRLKLRTELQKRVSRIELVFMPDQLGVAAIVTFSNGVLGSLMIFGEAVGEEILQAKGYSEINRFMVKPERGEIHRKNLLDLAERMTRDG